MTKPKSWNREVSGQGDISELVESTLRTLASDLDPQNDKSGYSLARRLCVRERPLVLKFLGDQILATGWYIKQSGGFDHMTQYFHFPPRFRLFCSKDEWDVIYSEFAHNKSGAGEGGKQGQTLGNRFLQGDVGHVLLGGIQQYLEGINTHEAEVSHFLLLAFYMDWDEWLSRHIADMVHNDGGQVNTRNFG